MTDSQIHTDDPRLDVAARRTPYAAPALVVLGTVQARTAGPIADGGNIDQLVGMTGGFRQADATS